MNTYNIKWVIIAPFNATKGFNRNYKSALRKAGFKEVGCCGIFADSYNSENKESVDRITKQIERLCAKINAYVRPKALFSFTITDKQFGLIGTEGANVLAQKKGWVGLPIDDDCSKVIPVTYNQMYRPENGAIKLRLSQV